MLDLGNLAVVAFTTSVLVFVIPRDIKSLVGLSS